jgi:hypothetical protein
VIIDEDATTSDARLGPSIHTIYLALFLSMNVILGYANTKKLAYAKPVGWGGRTCCKISPHFDMQNV